MKEFVYHRYLLPVTERMASKKATLDGDVVHTYEQHLDRVLRLASAMHSELGIGRGDRFAVMALNGHPFLELYHAGFLSGGVINPLNLRLAPKELEFILADSGCTVCFVDFLFAGAVDAVRKEAGIEKVVLLGDLGADEAPHDLRYADLLDAGSAEVPEEPDEDDPAILMYTGGTTGTPKGVVLDNRALMINLYKVATQFSMDEGIVYLHQTPMFHAASLGAIVGVAAVGGQTTFVPMFRPDHVLDVIERHQVTMTVMVPTMVSMMLDHPSFAPDRLKSLDTLVYGASPMPTAVVTKVLETFPDVDVYQGYGMTENCGLLTCLGPEEHRRGGDILRSAGRPLPGSVVTIRDEDGNAVPTGTTGEVCAQAGNYMVEYWNRQEDTESAFRGGWYHTGDAGYVDENGYLYLVDRVKDMIVTGGENVYSAEVENAIASNDSVAQVAVIGIPSERWGEEVHAVVVPKEGASISEDEVIAWARERIAGYKVPKSVEIRTEPLPLSGAMKVLKRELRAQYWEGRERSVN